tara:strand:- start:15432 stop:15974 length:543 start_codon:yes stop_codon:yes gene_type:complete
MNCINLLDINNDFTFPRGQLVKLPSGEVGYRYDIIYHIFSIPLLLWRGEIPGYESKGHVGLYNGDTIQISVQNLKTNPLTVAAVIWHELAHVWQYASVEACLPEWYNHSDNKTQDELYRRYKGEFSGYYAADSALEAAAEVFRLLAGFPSKEGEDWETNEQLLKEYKKFFNNQLFFKEFV